MNSKILASKNSIAREGDYFLYDLSLIELAEKQELMALSEKLPDSELERATKFIKESDQIKARIQKTILYSILAEKLSCDISEVEVSRTDLGKPYLSGYNLNFNLSHSGDLLFLGFHPRLSIGVDVEILGLGNETSFQKAFDRINRLSLKVLSDPERTFFEKLETRKDKIDYFYQRWCVKESYVKCSGKGFTKEIMSIDALPIKIRPGHFDSVSEIDGCSMGAGILDQVGYGVINGHENQVYWSVYLSE